MRLQGENVLCRIMLTNYQQHHHRPLYEVLVERAWRQGLAGATVLKGLQGFLPGGPLLVRHRWKPSNELPVVVEDDGVHLVIRDGHHVDAQEGQVSECVARAGELGLGRGERNEDARVDAVEHRPALLRKDPHNGQRGAPGGRGEPDPLPHGVEVAEKVPGDPVAEHRDLGAAVYVLLGEELPASDGQALELLVGGRRADGGDAKVGASEDDLAVDRILRHDRGGGREGARRGERGEVVVGELPPRVGPTPLDAAARGRHDDDEVGAHAADLRCDLLLGARGDRHQGDHRGNADDDAQHRQGRAQPVGQQPVERDAHGLE